MGKLTDEVVLQAVRDSLAIEACHWNMWNYTNGTQQIAPTEFPSGTDTLMAYVYPLVSGFSQSAIRNKIKSLANDGHFILRQSYNGAQIQIVANQEHSEKLKKLANKWW